MSDIVFKFVQPDIKEQFLKQLQECFEGYFKTPFNREYYKEYLLNQLKKRKVREYKQDISLPWEQQPDYEGIMEDFEKNFPQKVLYQVVAEKKGLEIILHLKYLAFSFSSNGKSLFFLDKKTDTGFTVLVWSHEVERIYWSYQKRSNALIDGKTQINTLYDDILLEKKNIISGAFDIIDDKSAKELGETFIVDSPFLSYKAAEQALEQEKLSESIDELGTEAEDSQAIHRSNNLNLKKKLAAKAEAAKLLKNALSPKNQRKELVKGVNYKEVNIYSFEKTVVKANKLVELWEYHEDTFKYIGGKHERFEKFLREAPLEVTTEHLDGLQKEFQAIIGTLPSKRLLFSSSMIYLLTPDQKALFDEINQTFEAIVNENKVLNQLI
ncbi:MAG: hypothetical protein LBS33_06210 [Streptococcaceae bacterium]|jgi:hypothetical protein|nr:hypothetical protein [Streptococcaceae bacterium]